MIKSRIRRMEELVRCLAAAVGDRAAPPPRRLQTAQDVIDLLQEQLTDENMQELNARVDLDKKDPATVAQEYLSETGLVSE